MLNNLKKSLARYPLYITLRGGFWTLFYSACTHISPKLNSNLRFKKMVGVPINWDNPSTFDEKLMWLKHNVYTDNALVTKCADKYRVRDYVRECGCPELLNELLFTFDTVDEIEWDKLPNQFAMKCNHGFACNIICSDKSKLDIKHVKKQLKKWMSHDFSLDFAEMQYKKIPRKIVCEKYIGEPNGVLPADYKVYCFNGRAEIIMVCVGREKGRPAFYLFNKDWQLLRINPSGINAPENFALPKMQCVDAIFAYAEKLAWNFPFVRVDFYEHKGVPIFGELTFTPSNCIDIAYTKEAQRMMGAMLKIK